MAADNSKPYFPAKAAQNPRQSEALTAESKFWRSFKTKPFSTNLILPVTAIEYSPIAPHDLAFSVSASVHLYNGSLLEPKSFSPLTSFSDVAYSPSFRCDGQLLAAGGETGHVQVFKLNKGGHAIRRLKAHSRPVHMVRYPKITDKLHLFSAGDDALLTYWDLTTESQLLTIPSAHKDYIRAGSASPVNSEVIATGSYDHSIKVWDVRVSNASTSVLNFNHGNPVESVMFLPSGGLIATAGGNCVKIWDVIAGGRLIHKMDSHNKTVTAMCLGKVGDGNDNENDNGSRILSVSIDGYLKCFDFASFKVTHSMRYPAQLLSVGFSPDGLSRVVGTANGTIYIGKKKKKKESESTEVVGEFSAFLPKPEQKSSKFRYFRTNKPVEGDYVVKKVKKVKLAEHDKLLKKFRHKDALVSALNGKKPSSVVAVMEELVARKKLLRCVENLDLDELGLLLGFLHKYATMPRYARLLMGLATKVIDMRGEDMKDSEGLRCHVRNLKRMVAEEMKIQHTLQEIQGMISPLLAIADLDLKSKAN